MSARVRTFPHVLSLSLAAVAFAALASTANADVVTQTYTGALPATFTGTLANESSVLEETFTLAAPGDFQAYTTSYNAGGFESNLSLYDAGGNFLASSGSPGTSPFGTGVTDFDAYLSDPGLAAGTYTIALTDFELSQSITATNLSDGFTSNLGDGINFVDQNNNTRDGDYSLTLTSSSPVPEPATLWLTLPVAAAGLLARRYLVS